LFPHAAEDFQLTSKEK